MMRVVRIIDLIGLRPSFHYPGAKVFVMSLFIKIRGAVMVAGGVAGLVINESGFFWARSLTVTVIFALIIAAGLVNLAWAFWRMKGE
jgi:hypothetical protein